MTSRYIMLLNLAREVVSVSDVNPEDILPLGSKSQVFLLLADLFPRITLTTPGWACLQSNDVTIEFDLRHVDKDVAPNLMLRLEGTGYALDVLQALHQRTGWYALDCIEGRFIELGEQPAHTPERAAI